jgi:hypothetical protein
MEFIKADVTAGINSSISEDDEKPVKHTDEVLILFVNIVVFSSRRLSLSPLISRSSVSANSFSSVG